MIEREYYIKDLFRPKQILNQFSDLYFESFKGFVELYNNGYIRLESIRLHIPIKTVLEFKFFQKLLRNTNIDKGVTIDIQIDSDLIEEVISLGFEGNFMITTDDEFNKSIYYCYTNYDINKWLQNNVLYIEKTITLENYADAFNELISIYNKRGWRFFKLRFKWHTFEEMKFKELHKFRFFLSQFRNWLFSTRDNKNSNISTINIYDEELPIFISNDFKLYVNEDAFEENNILLDLYKYKDCNGEEIPYEKLNKFRSYMDVPLKCKFVNFNCNKKVMGDYSEAPYIQQTVGDIINAF